MNQNEPMHKLTQTTQQIVAPDFSVLAMPEAAVASGITSTDATGIDTAVTGSSTALVAAHLFVEASASPEIPETAAVTPRASETDSGEVFTPTVSETPIPIMSVTEAVASRIQEWGLEGIQGAHFSRRLNALTETYSISDSQVQKALEAAASPQQALQLIKVSGKHNVDVSIVAVMRDLAEMYGSELHSITNAFKEFYFVHTGETPEDASDVQLRLEDLAPDRIMHNQIGIESALRDYDALRGVWEKYNDVVCDERMKLSFTMLRNVYDAVRSIDAVDEFVDRLLDLDGESVSRHFRIAQDLIAETKENGTPPLDIAEFVAAVVEQLDGKGEEPEPPGTSWLDSQMRRKR